MESIVMRYAWVTEDGFDRVENIIGKGENADW